MEVTIVGSDVAVWTEVSVPSQTVATGICPALEDYIPHGIGGVGVRASKTQSLGSNLYILWRIHEESPRSLEFIEFSCDKPVHNSGLRLNFESALCPFASVVLVQDLSNQFLYNVTVLTVSGVLYSISLRVASFAKSRLSMQHQSTTERDIGAELTGLGKVTSLTATPELLIAGGQTGSIFCFPVGSHIDSRPVQPFELKEGESGLSRLWGLGFRGRPQSPVKCLAAQSLPGANLLFAVYEDRNLKVWNLVHRNRQFSQSMSPPLQLASSTPQAIWIEDLPGPNQELQLALHYGGNPSSETQRAAVVVFSLHLTQSDGGIKIDHMIMRRTFSIGQGNVISCKMLSDKVWVLLKSGGSGQCELLSANLEEDFILQKCRLQEYSVSEQLFQGTGQSWDELLFALHHIDSDSANMDDDLVPSLFLRRLLQPGLRQHAALKAVLQSRGRYLSDFEISSLTLDGLRKEIKASIRSEPNNSNGTLKEWISFCSAYVESWNQNSVPYGLFADVSTGSVGLIRKSSVSVIRTQTLFEQLLAKRVTGNGEGAGLPQDWDEAPGDQAVLGGLLKCLETMTTHLGHMALGVFHEALLRPPSYSLDGLTSSFMLILDVGYTPLQSTQVNLAFGVDGIRAKMQQHHQRQRKFALRISQALQTLQAAAGSWEVVLDVVGKYSEYLVFPAQSAMPSSTSGGGVVPLGSASTKMLAQATGQISWTHFEGARSLFLLLSYLVKVQGQVGLTPTEVARIQLNLLPRVQEGLTNNLLLHWLTVSFAEVPPSEDCSLQLSSLQIDGSRGEKVQPEMLGAGELALAEILAAAFLESAQGQETFRNNSLPEPDILHNGAARFVGWLLVGEDSYRHPLTFSGRAIALATILLQHGQYGSLESFLTAVEHFTKKQQLSDAIESMDGEWSARLHLLGICSLARAHSVLENTSKEKHIGEAIQCFFRAASGIGEANKVLQTVLFVPQQQVQGRSGATAAWRLQYFEWVMQLFDQYNLSEGACQFAHAALEQVDDAVGAFIVENGENDSHVTIKGRLWANVFKFSLDLELYGNAYCAIISNPDEQSKDICLRRLIIVLCDHKASQALCGNELPYGGLLSRVEEELVTKAHNSDVSVKAGLYKLLYALHMHHHNVGRAAGYMYEYGMSLRDQGLPKSQLQGLSLLKEQLDAFAAAINALQLVESSDELVGSRLEWLSPIKRQRISGDNLSNGKMIHANRTQTREQRTIDVEHLVKEHALTLARIQLLSADAKSSSLGVNVPPSEVVLSLLQHGLYEMAFSLVFLCWKDSSQQRELETVFQVMARKCCLLQLGTGSNSPHKIPEDLRALTLVPDSPSTDLEPYGVLSTEVRTQTKFLRSGTAAKCAWDSLKEYLEKYWKSHPNIRAVVADTILSVDKHMELPLWLIDTFKGGKDSRGMNSGSTVADPAALLRIYLNHERYVEATYLLLEYLQAATRLRPGDVIKRKQACGVWFPYTLVDRLLQHLSKIRGPDERISQPQRLHASLQSAVLQHFDLIKKESDDVRVIGEAADFNGPWKGFS
ncbi:unnamed protein product [Calypogeia fissa]